MQMVHLLPHERLDLYTEAVSTMKNMALAQDHKNCEKFFKPEENIKCFWPMNQADKKSYTEKNMIRDMPILDTHDWTHKETGWREHCEGEGGH